MGGVAWDGVLKVVVPDLGLTQTAVRDDDKRSSLAMTPSLLTPCWDGNRSGSFFNMGNLQTWVHLKNNTHKDGSQVQD